MFVVLLILTLLLLYCLFFFEILFFLDFEKILDVFELEFKFKEILVYLLFEFLISGLLLFSYVLLLIFFSANVSVFIYLFKFNCLFKDEFDIFNVFILLCVIVLVFCEYVYVIL